MEEFLELKGELVALEDLTELQKKYYDYTCREGDCIRTCMIPSPQLNENDLEIEKKDSCLVISSDGCREMICTNRTWIH